MDKPEVPEATTPPADRPAGPDQPGPRPEEGASPEGTPPFSGSSQAGHPPDSSAQPPPHPVSEDGSAAPESALEDTAPAPEPEPVVDDKDLPSSPTALKILVKRYESEKNDYLQQLQRIKADFENYRKRMIRQQTEHMERAAESLVEKLLPVLDNMEAAVTHGQGLDQVQASFMSTLEKEGLERIHPQGKPFDPAEADAVAHEDGDGGPVVAEVLRAGYRWKGRVLRPAMVRVRG